MSEIAIIRPLFTTTRRPGERAGPERFLKQYRGYLQADAYVACDSFFTDPARGMVEVGCSAHGRRHAYNARDTEPARMGAVLAYIAQLYKVEQPVKPAASRVNNVACCASRPHDESSNNCTYIC